MYHNKNINFFRILGIMRSDPNIPLKDYGNKIFDAS